jgi:hypothetical protein
MASELVVEAQESNPVVFVISTVWGQSGGKATSSPSPPDFFSSYVSSKHSYFRSRQIEAVQVLIIHRD